MGLYARMERRWSNPWRISDEQCSGEWLFDQYKVYGGFLRENQIGNAGLAWSTGDCAGNPERGRVEKEQLHEQEVQKEEENRQSS